MQCLTVQIVGEVGFSMWSRRLINGLGQITVRPVRDAGGFKLIPVTRGVMQPAAVEQVQLSAPCSSVH